MAKVYMLTDADFEKLLTEIDRDPRWGTQGGSGRVLNAAEQSAHEQAHRFYNFVLRRWVDDVKK